MTQKKIMVVDDEKAIINLLNLAFTKAGFQVRTAQSGQEALSILETERIHVLFLDLNMPQMDGMELCRRIKKEMPMSIVYAITGHASLFELASCRDAGFDDYFKKPADIKTLVKAAENALDRIERWKKG